MTAIALPQNAIFQDHDQIKTTSLKVADAFGKRHTHVLRKLETIECSPEFSSAHFWAHDQEVSIGKGAKRLSKVYEMTKDGFMFLVMGFTGKKAAQIKEAYINEFNRMADLLNGRGQQPSTVEDRQPLNIAIRALANQRAAQGQPADYASVWRTVNGYLGVEHIENASKEQVKKGLGYVQQLLEGEFLPKEALPTKPSHLDYSVQRWRKLNPWFASRQVMQPRGVFNITPDMLYGPDAQSPTLTLVRELEQQGHNLQACRLEIQALQHYLENARNALHSIQQRCSQNLTGQGFRLQV